ncbi:hypothetical protein Ssi03_77160 [Sphaerisporangium siamense]|uniref:Holin n=1 Tax=Sphaerisporangium siamense TaxID=795645 RepID=A0A7W7GCS0_9ACTN|nr:holin [Sphaerisporangium siamense]MBB4702266.1 hypothetical protein [Sphaerisporangium siamense]GII89726.1 hypothetical protein Ssi03_77160 [Sphaerisporangium siamense]
MHISPDPAPSKRPVEAKVKAAGVGAFLGSIGLLAILQAVDADHSLIDFLPDWLETVLIPLIPTGITVAAGWRAQHTPRPDLPDDQR